MILSREKVLIACFILAVYFNFLIGMALAGTETGEFCPTCPDWTDLEGWLAKKKAYEIYQRADIVVSAGSSFNGRVIIDVRDPEDYQSGHIPGARNLYWGDLSPGLLDPVMAEDILRNAGINNSDHLLIYGDEDDKDKGADYVFWALNYLGHQDLSKLNGGINAAWGAGIRPETSLPSVEESKYTIHIVPWLQVNKGNIKVFLELPQVQILDARGSVDYGNSELTGISIPMDAEMLYNDLLIKDAATLRDLLENRGLKKDGTLLIYGTPQAYSLFFVLEFMGYNATLLEGDWWMETEWSVSNIG